MGYKEIISYYLNITDGIYKKEENSLTESITFEKNLGKNNIITFSIINLVEYNQSNLKLNVVLPAELEDKTLTIFELRLYQAVELKDLTKFLFFAKKGMKIFLENYYSIIDYLKKSNDLKNNTLKLSYHNEKVYYEAIIKEINIVTNDEFNKILESDKFIKNTINQDNIGNFYFNPTYHRTGRLNMCVNYKGTDIDIKSLKKFQIIKLKTIRGTEKEFLVIDLNLDNVQCVRAIIIENNKKYKLNDVLINDNDLIYLAEESLLEDCYDALFKDNRLLCKNWKNARLLS